MLSKAPPVPQVTPSQSLEEGEVQEVPQNVGVEVAEGEIPNPEVGDRIVEELHEARLDENASPEGSRVPRQVPAGPTREQQQQLMQREPRVQKPADDRLFTWAAVVLTIAIAVLLFKKFMKASGHGAVFMNES